MRLKKTYSREKIRGWRHGRHELWLGTLLSCPYAKPGAPSHKYTAWVSGWAIGRGFPQYTEIRPKRTRDGQGT